MGIKLGISLAVGGGDLDRAQELLARGGACSASNLEVFWQRCQNMTAAGQDATVRACRQQGGAGGAGQGAADAGIARSACGMQLSAHPDSIQSIPSMHACRR